MRKLHPIDDRKTSSSLCVEHIFVFLAEFLEYKIDNFVTKYQEKITRNFQDGSMRC